MYYRHEYKYRNRTNDLKPWATCFIIVLLMLLVHCCAGQEQEAIARDEVQLASLTDTQRAEIVNRTMAVYSGRE